MSSARETANEGATIERVMNSFQNPDEKNSDGKVNPTQDNSLRPQDFTSFPGQTRVVENLKVYVSAARGRKQAMDHVILHGPPGLGKTTLAKIIANELHVPFVQTSAPAIEKTGDLAGILAGLEPHSVLFIDEIHRLNIAIEEVLYSAMEDFCVDLTIGQGPSARTAKMNLSPFTLIGATTRLAKLSAPLISRFGIQEHMDFYETDALTLILSRSADILGIELLPEGAEELAKRSRGTPRIANRLLKRIRDYADFDGIKIVDLKLIHRVLERLNIDELGLDHMDRAILEMIQERYNGGPVGIEALAATIGEDKATLEDIYEPFLVHQNLVMRGPRGREVTALAVNHLKKTKSEP